MRAAGPTDGNRKHHPKAAPLETASRSLAVRVFSQPQKMVFDCVYGRPEKRAVADSRLKEIRRLSLFGRQHVTISHLLAVATRVLQCGVHGTQAALSAVRYPLRRCDGQKCRGSHSHGSQRVMARHPN